MTRTPLVSALCTLAVGCGHVHELPSAEKPCGSAVTDADAVIGESHRPRPPHGPWQLDADLGGCVARVSDRLVQADTPVFAPSSTRRAWNADDTRVLLASGHVLETASFQLTGHVTGPAVWAADDPDVVIQPRGNALMQRNQSTGLESELARFHEYASLDATLLGDPSATGRLLLTGERAVDGGREIFLWDRDRGEKSATLSAGFDSIGRARIPRKLMLASSGKFAVIVWPSAGTGSFHGIEVFDDRLASLGQPSTEPVEADVTRDARGVEWLVHQQITERGPAIVKRSLDMQSENRELLVLDWFHSVRLSCRAEATDSCLVATHGDPTGAWQPFTGEIFELSLDSNPEEPRVVRRVHHRSAPSWIAQRPVAECGLSPTDVLPNPTASRDGRFTLFTSNWSENCFGELYLIRR
jgi:hypothetical protein